MASTKTLIYDALGELQEAEFKEFRWRLANDLIPRGKLEKADRTDVVDLMEQHLGRPEAGRTAVCVLRSIKQNQCAEDLERKLQSEAVSASSSAAAAVCPPAATGVTVNINSSEGGIIKAPVFNGGDFKGPLTFNF